MIKNKIAKDAELKLEQEEMQAAAMDYAKAQIQQYYGLQEVPDEYAKGFAERILQNQEEANKIAEISMEKKIVNYVKENAKVDSKEISFEKFNKFFEK